MRNSAENHGSRITNHAQQSICERASAYTRSRAAGRSPSSVVTPGRVAAGVFGGGIAVGVAWAGAAAASPLGVWTYVSLGGLLGLVTYFDLTQRRVPNALVLAGLATGAPLALLAGTPVLVEGLAAAVGAALVLYLIRATGRLLFGQPGMGMGDVKLALVLGLYVGYDVGLVLYLAVLVGGLVALFGLATGAVARKTHLPFAPCLAVGVLLEAALDLAELAALVLHPFS